MRNLVILTLLLAVTGCPAKPSAKHIVLPVGYSGIFKIEKRQGHFEDSQIKDACYTFTVPESGVLAVAPDVFDAYCSPCNKLTATFADDQVISIYSPLAQPSDFASDEQMLLGLLGSGDFIWYVVGTHKQLSRFLIQTQIEKYRNLERFLPPNQTFQQTR